MNRPRKIHLAYTELAVFAFLYSLLNLVEAFVYYFTANTYIFTIPGPILFVATCALYVKDALSFESELKTQEQKSSPQC